MTLKEKATQILNTFSEEQLAAFVTLFGSLNDKQSGEPSEEDQSAE